MSTQQRQLAPRQHIEYTTKVDRLWVQVFVWVVLGVPLVPDSLHRCTGIELQPQLKGRFSTLAHAIFWVTVSRIGATISPFAAAHPIWAWCIALPTIWWSRRSRERTLAHANFWGTVFITGAAKSPFAAAHPLLAWCIAFATIWCGTLAQAIFWVTVSSIGATISPFAAAHPIWAWCIAIPTIWRFILKSSHEGEKQEEKQREFHGCWSFHGCCIVWFRCGVVCENLGLFIMMHLVSGCLRLMLCYENVIFVLSNSDYRMHKNYST